MTTIFSFPNGKDIEATSAEIALEILEEREENLEGHTILNAVKNEFKDFEDFQKEFTAKEFKNTESKHENALETFGKDLEFVQATEEKYVWTIQKSRGGLLWIHAGFQTPSIGTEPVNYLISKKPWVTKSEVFLW